MMRTVRRLIYREVLVAVAFTTLAFLGLMFFFDFVDQLGRVGRGSITMKLALLSTVLELPGRLYELLPITLLIGGIYALSRLAQSSEFTILRTAGLGPGRALGLLSALGLGFAVLTFVVGDVLAPAAEQQSSAIKARAAGVLGGTKGAWMRDRAKLDGAAMNYSVHVKALEPDGDLVDVRIFEMNDEGRLVRRIEAPRARADEDGVWTLTDARVMSWRGNEQASSTEAFSLWTWPSNLKASVVSAAVLPVSTMNTIELWRYSRHLSAHDQSFQQHAIAFWKKALYPLACVVMLALALPFAYLHARSGGISWKVFGGIMIGISFSVFNHLSSHLGMLQDWSPWLAAAAPALVYWAAAMAAFAWLVRFR